MWEGNIFNTAVTTACAAGCGILLGIFASNMHKKYVMKSIPSNDKISEEAVFSDFVQGDLKLVLVVQNGLKMGKGKIAAQCAHASVAAYQNCSIKNPSLLKEWLKSGQRKVVLKVDSEEALMEIAATARRAGLNFNLVCDAGRTQIPSGSRTVLAVGPDLEQNIDKVTGHLKLL
ncbi:peptidyl-tRNA hydrolase 2, mitochondrial-like [Argiope bruennichi]|uniref:peptidyl-tRNA hydrolase n=1 Tax=Argiope bruennichi TaxID=94029 RepID=A0A8T0FVB5_ARGBR|nr:peptidyl-tRNA hydrolase 2, mitochondrial-like [Argiope bruennichi]KAF8792703.1 Peptidyl-tRNA hydrolase 2 like protein [Argiope bruennichi]